MNLGTASAAIALPTVVGVGIVSLIAPHLRLYAIERLALGFLVGVGTLAGLWFLLTPFYSVVAPVWLLSGLLVLGLFASRTALLGLLRSAMNERRWSPGPLDIALLTIVIAEVAMLFAAALRTPLGWDGVFNFEMKARMLFEHTPQGQFPVSYLSDSSRQWSHPQYPMLIPVAEFWVYSWIGAVDQSAIKLLFPLFYVSLIVLMSSAIARAATPRVGLAAGAGLGLLPPLTLLPGAASGYADVPLAAAVCGALCHAHRGFRTGDPSSFTLAGVLAAIAAWTKTEGLLLAVAFGVLAMATAWWSLGESPTLHVRFRDAAKMLWIPIVCAAPWLLLQRFLGTPGPDFLSISPEHVLQGAVRIPSIAATFARELLRPGHWGLVWTCWLCAAIVVAWQRDTELADGFLFAVVALSLVLYVGVFTMSAWSDVTEHIRWALPRLLVALAPIALMSTVLVIWDNLTAAEA